MSGSTADNAGRQSGVVAAAAAGIEILSSDPTAEHGKCWFNSTTSLLKVYNKVGAWANGGNLAAARYGPSSSTNGTQSATIASAGYSGGVLTSCEQYNGSSWSSKNAMLAGGFQGAGAGTASAGLAMAGEDASAVLVRTEEFDATSWTAGGNLNTGKTECNLGCGTLSAALTGGGWGGSAVTNASEEYNGTAWTAGNNMGTAAKRVGGCGIQTAAIGTGHYVSSNTTTAEQYDGTNWSSLTSRNTALYYPALAGTLSLAVCFGGNTGSKSNVTEDWNGTSWTVGDTLTTARSIQAGAGTALSALSIGGDTGSASAVTEEYTGAVTAQTVTDS